MSYFESLGVHDIKYFVVAAVFHEAKLVGHVECCFVGNVGVWCGRKFILI